MTIRLLLADDQALVRGALAALLSLESDLEVAAEVDRGDLVVPTALEVRPDIAVLDIEMPGLDGIAATGALRQALPACRVLVVTTFGRPGYLRRAMEAGASGFLVKDAPAEQLADAIRRVHAGLRVVDPAASGRHRPAARAQRRDGPQLPELCDGQDRRPDPRRGGARRRAARLVVAAPGRRPGPLASGGGRGHPDGW